MEAVDEDSLLVLCQVHGWNRDDPNLEDRLRERGLLVDGELTIAGALLLTRPEDSLAASKFVVEIRSYVDEGVNYRRRNQFGGPLFLQVEAASNYISNELGSDLIIIGLVRHELPRLPAVVIREAVANAVAHRSYELDRTAILVEIRPHDVTVTSPGSLPEGVTIETMRQAQAARNPTIIDVLRRCGLTEDAGRGVDVMQDTMRDEMLEPPLFEELGGFVRVTLRIQGPISPEERAWLSDLEARGVLEPEDRLLLVHASRGEVLTNARAREVIGLDHIAARAALQRLRNTGLLVQQGSRGGASYLMAPGITLGKARPLTNAEIEEIVLREARLRPIHNEDVRRLTGLDRTETLALLRRLVERGELVRRGSRRGTKYVAV